MSTMNGSGTWTAESSPEQLSRLADLLAPHLIKAGMHNMDVRDVFCVCRQVQATAGPAGGTTRWSCKSLKNEETTSSIVQVLKWVKDRSWYQVAAGSPAGSRSPATKRALEAPSVEPAAAAAQPLGAQPPAQYSSRPRRDAAVTARRLNQESLQQLEQVEDVDKLDPGSTKAAAKRSRHNSSSTSSSNKHNRLLCVKAVAATQRLQQEKRYLQREALRYTEGLCYRASHLEKLRAEVAELKQQLRGK